MANVLTRNIWNCDSLGILSTKPVLVKAIMFTGTAEAHAFELKWWDEDNPTTTLRLATYTITTSTDDTVTSTGNFASAWADGNVAKCLKTTGSDTGVYGLIKTAGNTNAFVTHLSPFTAEADKVGDWANYPTYRAFLGTQPTDTNEEGKWYPFPGDGFWFPNLALDSLSAGSIQIYVG
jgi:hypothetical protein